MYSVYEFYGVDDRLLYVGVTRDMKARFAAHHSSPWYSQIHRIAVEGFGTAEEAASAERDRIRDLDPLYNRDRSGKSSATWLGQVGERIAAATTVAFRTDLESFRLLALLSKKLGVKKAGVFALAIRRLAAQERVD